MTFETPVVKVLVLPFDEKKVSFYFLSFWDIVKLSFKMFET